MHKYLRAIGFSCINNRKEYENLIRLCVQDATKREYTTKDISEEDKNEIIRIGLRALSGEEI